MKIRQAWKIILNEARANARFDGDMAAFAKFGGSDSRYSLNQFLAARKAVAKYNFRKFGIRVNVPLWIKGQHKEREAQ